jgi:hypothetical protein
LLVLIAGRVDLSPDFEELSAIVYAPEVFRAVTTCSHCLLKVVEAEGLGKRGSVAESVVEVGVASETVVPPVMLASNDQHADLWPQIDWKSSTFPYQQAVMQLKI